MDKPKVVTTGAVLSSPPEGFSQFVSRVLDQLSLSSWLPAALFVCVGAVLLELRSQDEIDLIGAVVDLTAKPVGVLIVIAFALVSSTMLLQAFELSAIRLLEGYWPAWVSRIGLTGACVSVQVSRLRRRRDRLKTERIKAFRIARDRLLDLEADPEIIAYHRRIVHGETSAEETDAGVEQRARAFDWRPFAPPGRLRNCEALERAAGLYPREHRTMPTALGNALRSGEDKIKNVGEGSLRTFVVRHWHLLPTELQILHDQYRNRLDLYCSLVFVCGVLALGGGALLATQENGLAAGALVLVTFGATAEACYRAAVMSAEGYIGALQAIDKVVGASAR